jgi:uncharacterized protein
MPLFSPTYHFKKVSDIPLELLQKLRIKLIFIDVDNTLAPRDSDKYSSETLTWIKSVKEMGIRFAILSNGMPKRVIRSAKILGFGNIYPGLKPLPFAHWFGMIFYRTKPSATIMIGDQLPTDILGANLAGIKSILVDPVDSSTDVKWTRFTRKLFGKKNS